MTLKQVSLSLAACCAIATAVHAEDAGSRIRFLREWVAQQERLCDEWHARCYAAGDAVDAAFRSNNDTRIGVAMGKQRAVENTYNRLIAELKDARTELRALQQ